MKFLQYIFVLLLISSGAFAQDDLVNSLSKNKSDQAKEKYKFKTIINVDASPVKNQGSSGTCWSYSGNSFLESEMMRTTDSYVDISEIYTARCAYIERARNYVRMHGNVGWGDGAELHDVVQVYGKYGALPYEAYTGLNYGTENNRFGEMQAALKGFLEGIVKNKNGQLTKNWMPAFTAALDAYLGQVPETFQYKGQTYTPQSFADKVVGLDADDYIEMSAFQYAPLYKPTMLMVPDNWSLQSVWNIKMNEMTEAVDNALESGYTVAWATDVSERYFSWKNGVAVVPEKDYVAMSEEERKTMFDGPKPERTITAKDREDAFDNYTTTDDHGMHIVGLAEDQNGKEYYMVKNSWGDKNDYKGYLYVSKTFFEYKTTAILMNKNALPRSLKNNLGM